MRLLVIDTNSVRAAEQSKAAALCACGHRVTLLVPTHFKENYQRLRAHRPACPPFRLVLAPMLGKPPNRCLFWQGLGPAARPVPDAILVLADENFWLTSQALLWREIFCPGSVFVCHSWQNLDFDCRRHPQPSRLLYELDTFLERRVFRRAHAIIARNHEAMEVLRRRGYSGRLVHVPWAVDTRLFRPRPRENGLPYTIGYVGRFVEEKGIMDLMKASQQMQAPHRLLLVGAGPLEPNLKKMATPKVSNPVDILPIQAHQQMPELYQKMDVLVLPSRSGRHWKEQFGRTLAEAMACEVAVVGSRSGAIPEVIGPAGRTFPEGDSGALAATLDRLADPEARLPLGRMGLSRARERFSWAAWALRTTQLLEELAH
jgi:glycosyltransferase involved in cell wall biosynthesis